MLPGCSQIIVTHGSAELLDRPLRRLGLRILASWPRQVPVSPTEYEFRQEYLGQWESFSADDALKLAPSDLLEQANKTLIQSLGVPPELYQGAARLSPAHFWNPKLGKPFEPQENPPDEPSGDRPH